MNAIRFSRSTVFQATLSLLALCLTGRMGAFASEPADPGKQAIVVGIAHYPHLSSPDDSPKGDVRIFSDALRKRKFNVNVIENENATLPKILEALKEIGHAGGKTIPVDQFVFYFAGKSSALPDGSKGYILPYDFDKHDINTAMSGEAFRAAIDAVAADSRTVVLDTDAAAALMNVAGTKHVCFCVSDKAGQVASSKTYTQDSHQARCGSRQTRGSCHPSIQFPLRKKQDRIGGCFHPLFGGESQQWSNGAKLGPGNE